MTPNSDLDLDLPTIISILDTSTGVACYTTGYTTGFVSISPTVAEWQATQKFVTDRHKIFPLTAIAPILNGGWGQLDRKNADKVYNILSKESVECFLHPVRTPLSPSSGNL